MVTTLSGVLGAAVLGVSFRVEPGTAWFYAATLLLAAVWTTGAVVSGPLHLGRLRHPGGRRPVVEAVVVGLALLSLFAVGSLLVRQLPWLEDEVRRVVAVTDEGTLPLLVVVTAVNGIAEELFFRGAVHAAVPRHPVVVTTAAYVAATLATGNVMLTFAAVLLGVVVGLERRATGGVLAPIVTHLTWSLGMLLLLPVLF